MIHQRVKEDSKASSFYFLAFFLFKVINREFYDVDTSSLLFFDEQM